MKRLLVIFTCLALAALLFVAGYGTLSGAVWFANARDFLASVFFVESLSVAELQAHFKTAEAGGAKVKILVVPGHDNQYHGTEFRGVTEAEMNAEFGGYLAEYLRQDPEFSVMLARNENGYNFELADYFEVNRAEILKFARIGKRAMVTLKKENRVSAVSGVSHNTVNTDIATRLYGINKWANEHKVDITLHIHFNDYGGRRLSATGEYSGFAVYVPEGQYSNAKVSRALAEDIFPELAALYPVSDLPKENQGIVPDQDLIALGAFNTLDGAGVLTEYGYIYEPQFLDKTVRSAIFRELALRTARGVERFFGIQRLSAGLYGTTLLPYRWGSEIKQSSKPSLSALSLQAALAREGVFPPEGSSPRDCPLTGVFGPCTALAVSAFQKKYSITSDSVGSVGAATQAKLNELYSR